MIFTALIAVFVALGIASFVNGKLLAGALALAWAVGVFGYSESLNRTTIQNKNPESES